MADPILPTTCDFHGKCRDLFMPQIYDMGIDFPSEGRHAEDFFARKIRRFQLGMNTRTWVPEASMLTTRPLKPLGRGSVNSRATVKKFQ